MDIEAQEKISKLIIEQADKLGIALKALRKIRALGDDYDNSDNDMSTAVDMATFALGEISDYGKNSKDL